ncbi:MAG: hypothetical protein JXR77_00310 [Lentisphaeria bacterium]|nr:hypothetical protein [Lentisphaeria bacterium]
MKRAVRNLTGLVLALLAAGVFCLDVAAQDRTRVRITGMKFRNVRTPKFDDTSNPEASAKSEWLQCYLEYETEGGRDGWTNEITLEWAVLVWPGDKKPLLLTTSVTYVDIEDGKHRAVVYVRPNFIRRHTGAKSPNSNDFSAYVEVLVDGQRVARQEESRQRRPRNWWQAKEPDVRRAEGELLPRTETPFAHMDYDFYEHIKPKRP